MSAPRFRAIAFHNPDVDAGLPGLVIRPGGRVDMVDDLASVRQAVFLLLSTEPGERIMRPRYGCQIHRLAFAPNDDTTAGLAIHYVTSALLEWEPRVELLRVDASRAPEEADRLDVSLEYRVRSTQEVDRWVYPLRLQGGLR